MIPHSTLNTDINPTQLEKKKKNGINNKKKKEFLNNLDFSSSKTQNELLTKFTSILISPTLQTFLIPIVNHLTNFNNF